jgi:hypothetical protein
MDKIQSRKLIYKNGLQDAFVSLQNVDLKGRKKLLAKARVNLSDYYVAASVSPVAFKLKLFPESSKVSAAFVHFSVHRCLFKMGFF